MKKRKRKVVVQGIACLIVLLALYHFHPTLVHARAGGGGSTGGSASSSHTGLFEALLMVILAPFFFIRKFIRDKKDGIRYTEPETMEKLELKMLFFSIQTAWTSGDMQEVESKMDPTLYTRYQQQLAEYARSNKQNIVTDIQMDKVKVARSSQGKEIREILFTGTMIDYFEENGQKPSGEIKPVAFRDVWMIEGVGKELVVRDIENRI